ncbi:MAG: hypothetical protein FE834_02950 [Gammaproteobacteria bacterium]|nr:hypothetical protein [Gammaproteobacteria bacterium]
MNSEIIFDFKMSIKVAFSLIWRLIILNIVPNILFRQWEYEVLDSQETLLLISLLHTFIHVLTLVISCYWLFYNGRLGSMKIFFMEQADYQRENN